MDGGTSPVRSFRNKLTGLGLARGTVSDAVIAAAVKAVTFIVVPLLLIALLQASTSSGQIISGLDEVRTMVMAFGAAVVVISFAWAYHLRSTKARLLFGLIGAGILVAYAYAVFLTGGYASAMAGFGWFLPAGLMFGLASYMALGSALKFVRDYAFFRRAKARSEGEVAFRPTLGRGEFDLRMGNASSAASFTSKFIKSTLVRWSLIFLVLTGLLSFFGFGRSPAEAHYLSIIGNMVGVILLLGIPMTVLAWFEGYYPKGTISRAAFDIGLSLSFVFLIFLIIVQSGLTQAAQGFEAGAAIVPITLFLVMWAAISVLRAIGEFRDDRRPWKIRNGFEVKKKKQRWQVSPDSKLYELSPEIGRTSRGLVSAQRTFFWSVTMVEILILIGLGAARSAGADTGPLFQLMVNNVLLVMALGLILTFISFGRGFYPPGSLGRLLVGLLLVPGLFIYMFSIFLTPEVQDACQRAGLIIPFNLVVILVVVSILFVGFLQVTELIDARRAWLESIGRKTKPLKPIRKMSRRQEFRFRFGSTYDGTTWARKGMVRYLYYTTIMIIVLLTILDSTSYTIAGVDFSRLEANLRQTYIVIILLAIPLAAVRSAYGFYPSGSTSKLTFGLVMCLVGATYTYLALQGGQLVRGGDFGAVTAGVSVDFTFILNAFLIGWGLYVLTIALEYLSYRKEWVANDYRPVASKEVQARIKQQRLVEKEQKRAMKAKAEGKTVAEVEAEEAPDSEAEVEEEIKKEIGEHALQASKAAKKTG